MTYFIIIQSSKNSSTTKRLIFIFFVWVFLICSKWLSRNYANFYYHVHNCIKLFLNHFDWIWIYGVEGQTVFSTFKLHMCKIIIICKHKGRRSEILVPLGHIWFKILIQNAQINEGHWFNLYILRLTKSCKPFFASLSSTMSWHFLPHTMPFSAAKYTRFCKDLYPYLKQTIRRLDLLK